MQWRTRGRAEAFEAFEAFDTLPGSANLAEDEVCQNPVHVRRRLCQGAQAKVSTVGNLDCVLRNTHPLGTTRFARRSLCRRKRLKSPADYGGLVAKLNPVAGVSLRCVSQSGL